MSPVKTPASGNRELMYAASWGKYREYHVMTVSWKDLHQQGKARWRLIIDAGLAAGEHHSA